MIKILAFIHFYKGLEKLFPIEKKEDERKKKEKPKFALLSHTLPSDHNQTELTTGAEQYLTHNRGRFSQNHVTVFF